MAYHFPFLLLGHTLEEVLSRTNQVPEGRGCIFQQKPDVILTGAAEEDRLGKSDPVLIDGHAFAYYFQVNLPCVANDLHEFECDVKSDGNVHVKGVIDNDSREIRRMHVFTINRYQETSSHFSTNTIHDLF